MPTTTGTKKHEDGIINYSIIQQHIERRTAYDEYNEEDDDDHGTDG